MPRQQLAVALGPRAPRVVPGVEVGKLDPQESGLQPVEPLVVAELDVLALGPLTEVSQPAQAGSEHLVAGADGAAVSERAEVLARIERERGGVAERAGAASLVDRAVRLGGVLEHEQAV